MRYPYKGEGADGVFPPTAQAQPAGIRPLPARVPCPDPRRACGHPTTMAFSCLSFLWKPEVSARILADQRGQNVTEQPSPKEPRGDRSAGAPRCRPSLRSPPYTCSVSASGVTSQVTFWSKSARGNQTDGHTARRGLGGRALCSALTCSPGRPRSAPLPGALGRSAWTQSCMGPEPVAEEGRPRRHTGQRAGFSWKDTGSVAARLPLRSGSSAPARAARLLQLHEQRRVGWGGESLLTF